MKIAAHGFITDGGYSSAGTFPGVFRLLLEAGHEIDFFGVPYMTYPRSLDGLPGYRYLPLRVEWSKRYGPHVRAVNNQYSFALYSLLAHVAYQREAIRSMERMPEPYDVVLCLDTANLWKSRIPVISWPQGPPHTEWAALRTRAIARNVIRTQGALYYGAVQAFYAYRWLQGHAALGSSDLLAVGSPWAVARWREFGLAEDRVRLLPYAIDLEPLANVPPARVQSGAVTFLWLGRSVPRKRLDLFLAGFELVRERHPESRAVLVGGLKKDPSVAPLLERYEGDPNVEIRPPVDHAAIGELFAETHVFVQPSQNENFGFALAEALAAGRPVVAGPTNGTAAFAGDALFSFETYDAPSVASAMLRARAATLADPTGIARVARRAAREHFTPSDVAEQLLELAREAVAHRGAAPRAAKARGVGAQ